LPGRSLLWAVGGISIVGAIIFFIMRLPTIGWYLFGAGVIFEIATLGWHQRYSHVLDTPPEGFIPTGEAYSNPGAHDPVTVWQKGIRREYVKGETQNAPETH
jgi:hypothetical protein